MLKTKEFKNKTIATIHGNVEFDKDGVAESNEKAEKFLSKFSEFDLVEKQKDTKKELEKEVAEGDKVEKPKATRKTTTRKPRATATKKVEDK